MALSSYKSMSFVSTFVVGGVLLGAGRRGAPDSPPRQPAPYYGRGVLMGLGEADLSTVKTACGLIGATREHVVSTHCVDAHYL